MAKVIAVLATVAVIFAGCTDKRSSIEKLHDAVRKTLRTDSYSVEETGKSFGQTYSASTVEHIGRRARVRTGSELHGVFIGDVVYVADNKDPGSFFKCGKKLENGTLREFDHVSRYLRAAARAKTVKRRGKLYVFDALLRAANGRTAVEFTLDGGRVERFKVTTYPTGANLTPPSSILFDFDYRKIPEITVPPDEVVQDVADC